MKTLQNVRDRFYSDKVRSDVEKWCRTCDSCAALPLQLHSDQRRNFDSSVCKRLCEVVLGIDKGRKSALHPQSDGMVERFSRTILNSLSLLVSSNQQDWDKKLPLFLLSTGVPFTRPPTTPHPRCCLDVILICCSDLFGRPPDAPPLAPEDYVEKL
ncbi:retrovirus-related Pol polyprotein from transposon 412 [Trichonephila clavipes]|nr:retrovirus-related Pol polyprotein from transposon 412 [Trichonephila clavipes]